MLLCRKDLGLSKLLVDDAEFATSPRYLMITVQTFASSESAPFTAASCRSMSLTKPAPHRDYGRPELRPKA